MFVQRPILISFHALMAAASLALAGCAGEGSQSSTGSQTTAGGTSTAPVVQVPVAASGLKAVPGNAKVQLTWSASSNATSYEVKRATIKAGPYGQLGTTAATSYTDTGTVDGTTYFYVVAAVNSAGTSADSAPASATPVVATTPPPVTTPPVTPPPVTTPPVTTPPVTTPPVTTTPSTSLPAVAALSNVQVVMNGGSATITFDPVDNASDYRVYALPSNDQIQLASDGSVVIPNAVYRCAGTYQVAAPRIEDATTQDNGITTRVASSVDGYSRSLAEATLGYVYTAAGAGLIPVYAVGNPDIHADDDYFYRYQASREKKYTSSASEYASLVASGWRDDGIAFYVPQTASAATKPVLSNANLTDQNFGSRYYLNQGAELSSRSTTLGFSTAFNVLAASASGTQPLMRVFYQTAAGRAHDELAAGQAAFARIRNQGLKNAVATVHYSGLTAATTLVVEALDKGCPFQGAIASASAAAQTFTFSTYSIAHQPWYTVSALQKTVDSGEVFINGQSDGNVGKPKAIARAYVSVTPKARPQMDWMSTPASFAETFTTLACGAPDGNCFQQFREQSSTYDVSFLSAETNHWQAGNVLGELLINYADWAADTNGKVRITVKSQKATIASGSYVHATMEVNSVGSARRYPQMILSDQNIPVQYNLINGRSLILQTFGDFPSRVDLEICDHVTWDVNLQCPRFIFRHTFNSSGAISGINPLPEEDKFMAAIDAPTKFDLYTSNSRAYIFVNDKPYACANLATKSGVSPAPVAPTGPATVTFGDALYHSGADDNFLVKMPGGFINRHQQTETSRHYDNLGFSSGVAAPAWDETSLPCSSTMTTLNYDPSP
jgi:Repeat of unknown function (DUF5648)